MLEILETVLVFCSTRCGTSIVDDYFPVVDALFDAAEELEDAIYAGATRGTQVPRSVLDLEKAIRGVSARGGRLRAMSLTC